MDLQRLRALKYLYVADWKLILRKCTTTVCFFFQVKRHLKKTTWMIFCCWKRCFIKNLKKTKRVYNRQHWIIQHYRKLNHERHEQRHKRRRKKRKPEPWQHQDPATYNKKRKTGKNQLSTVTTQKEWNPNQETKLKEDKEPN